MDTGGVTETAKREFGEGVWSEGGEKTAGQLPELVRVSQRGKNEHSLARANMEFIKRFLLIYKYIE